MKCCLCSSNATDHVVYGLYKRDTPMNELDLCNDCSEQLWEKIKPTVNLGLMHYVIRPAKEDDK